MADTSTDIKVSSSGLVINDTARDVVVTDLYSVYSVLYEVESLQSFELLRHARAGMNATLPNPQRGHYHEKPYILGTGLHLYQNDRVTIYRGKYFIKTKKYLRRTPSYRCSQLHLQCHQRKRETVKGLYGQWNGDMMAHTDSHLKQSKPMCSVFQEQ